MTFWPQPEGQQSLASGIAIQQLGHPSKFAMVGTAAAFCWYHVMSDVSKQDDGGVKVVVRGIVVVLGAVMVEDISIQAQIMFFEEKLRGGESDALNQKLFEMECHIP
jgi:hypothetical protein